MRIWALRTLRTSAGQYAASAAVVAVVAVFAVLLIETMEAVNRAAKAAGFGGDVTAALGVVGFTFLGIAVVVAAIVITNTFTTVYAARLPEVALLRLIGATSGQVRRTALLDGAVVGLVGAIVGLATGGLAAAGGIRIVDDLTGAALVFEVSPAVVLVPIIGGVASTTAAAFSAARGISRTAPVEAVRSSALPQSDARAGRARTIAGVVLFVVGDLLLALGAVVGLAAPVGLLVAFPGGVLSIVGVILAASAVLGLVLRLVSRPLPRSSVLRLGAANLLSSPVRTARTALAVTIGIALITMFLVAGTMFLTDFLRPQTSGLSASDARSITTGFVWAVASLTSFSVIVAAIGVASTLSLSVLARRREIGVLRAVGTTRGQIRAMLVAEGVLVTLTGVIAGLVLGTAYGWVGYTATLGSRGLSAPALPPLLIVVLVLGAVVFGVVASLSPARRANRVPPAEALREA